MGLSFNTSSRTKYAPPNRVLVIFYYAFEAHNTFVRHLRILLTWLSLEHDSDTMLIEHDSPQWYDIVHFEHKLSWLCFGLPQKPSYRWRQYSLIINGGTFIQHPQVVIPYLFLHISIVGDFQHISCSISVV